jgi:UDP-glucose 4-epimerase
MQWLITGGCVFIGTSLVRQLLQEGGHGIRVLDNHAVGNHTALALTAAQGMDVIVHLAANTGGEPSVRDPHQDCVTNVLGTLNSLEAARHNGVKRFVFASSGAPLGACEPPLHEELAPNPVSPYGASKPAGEGYCSAYYCTFGVETVALRLGNVYGSGSSHKSSVIATFIQQARQGETWDFIYIDDLVRAIELAATSEGVGGEVFQVATSRETTVAELNEGTDDAERNHTLPVIQVFFRQTICSRHHCSLA